jgi:hypothetical protein
LVVVCGLFLVAFVCLFLVLCFAGTAYWTMYRSFTSSLFVAICFQTAGHDNLLINRFAEMNVLNDLAKAMKALDGKKILRHVAAADGNLHARLLPADAQPQ